MKKQELLNLFQNELGQKTFYFGIKEIMRVHQGYTSEGEVF